jgi:hypothetical protein
MRKRSEASSPDGPIGPSLAEKLRKAPGAEIATGAAALLIAASIPKPMDLSTLAAGLKKCLNVDVALPVIAKWSPELRNDAEQALAGKILPPDWLMLAGTPKSVPLFASANKGPGITPDFERIVEAVYQVDAWREYEDLEANLEIGDERGDYGTVAKHLDGAEKRARRAHALYLSAKLELLRFETECQKVQAGMRQKATEVLSDEKEDGGRRKQITDADVRAKMAEMYPDEFVHVEERLAKLKGAVAHMERLADLHRNRCFSASTLLSTLRK